MESTSNTWFDDTKKRVAGQRNNIQLLKNAEPLENEKLSKMDSSLKKLTAFMKKTKSIGASNPAAQLLPELDKLNLLKFLDEIAANICDVKLKASEIPDLVNFVVQLSCRYQQFPELLLNELKKILPYKKLDKIENPAKYKIDLKFLGELVLNGVFAKPGVDLLGNCLGFLVQTDTQEFTHVPLLLPFCRPTLFDFVGLVPFSEKSRGFDQDELEELTTTLLTENNRRAVKSLLKNYYDSLIKQLNSIRIKMNKVHKSIKKQERTKGDASQSDRQEFENLKQRFEKLKQMAQDFGELLGEEVPKMDEDLSDDEMDEVLARQIDSDLAEGKTSLWPDKDTMNFYECLMDTTRLSPLKLEASADDADDEKVEPEVAEEKVAEFSFADSVDAVDLTELEKDATTAIDDYVEEEEPEETLDEPNASTEPSSLDQILDSMHQPQFLGVQINVFLENLSSAMNRDLIDRAASHFVGALSKKSNRKKLINHFLNSPRDRLDLLPFYGRFLATINRVLPDITNAVTKELLLRFRTMACSKIEPPKKIKEAQRRTRKVDEGVFLSRFLAELTKFKLLPKAETLTCLRSLLVDLRSYKVDMAAVMIESAGIFLYRSSDSHAKMKVILEVVQRKMGLIKDPRHKILLENAYFSVLPPEDNMSVLHMRDPMKSYISTVVRSIAPTKRGKDPVKILLGIDWTDSSMVDYLCSQLSDVCAINYDYLADVADAVRVLSDLFPDLGVFVTDTVLESIRIALETNKIVHHQRLHCSVNYLNWLYVCGVCEFNVIMQVLYQLIRLGINLESYSLDQLIKRTNRIRVAADLVVDVIEYVDTGKSSVQLDNFIHYLLHFYYSTESLWKDRSEDLGEFPFDVVDRQEKMLAHIAKICGKKRITRYAKDLATSKENIAKIEEKYKFDVQRSLAQGLKMATTEATLDSIQEEDEDASDEDNEEVEDEETDDETEDEPEVDTSEHDEPTKAHYVDTTDPEEIHVHVKRKFDENDAEFDRDFDRMLAESIQMASHQPRQPIIDLTVPPAVRQKFERKINFVGENVNDEPKNFQMALMTKSKGKPMLKPVQLHVSQSMKDSWNQQRMHSEKERQQVKEITLQMNERIQQSVEEEPLGSVPQAVPNRFQTDPADCHIPAGPRQKH